MYHDVMDISPIYTGWPYRLPKKNIKFISNEESIRSRSGSR